MGVSIGMMSFAHMHGAGYASALRQLPNAKIVGVADHDPDRANAMAERLNTRRFDSYDELLSTEVDAVIVCSENVRHRELTERAATAGKAVLCEKPLATTVEDAQAMVTACARANVPLWTAFPCRYHPSAGVVKAQMDQGQTGRIWGIHGTNRGRCPFGWFVQKPLSGGGAVMDHTVHVTDLLRWLLRSEVTEVYCDATNGMYHQDFDDTGLVSLTFENGVFATIDCSWSRPKSYPTWGDVTLEIVGEGGVLSLEMFSQDMALYQDQGPRVSWENWGSNMDLGLMKAFVNSLEVGSPPEVSGVDGLRATEVVAAAYQSIETGQPVKLNRVALTL
jgi:predicted dehydrogenase